MRLARRTWLDGLIVLVVVVAYWQTTRNDFVWDDAFLTQRNPYLDPSHLGTLLTSDLWIASAKREPSFYYRPFAMLTFAINRWVLGNGAASYHFGNVALHAATAVALRRAMRALSPRGSAAIAAIAALLFALTPLSSEAVAWIAGRFDVLGTLFALVALIAYVRGSTLGTVLAYAAAAFSKESFLVVPALFVLFDLIHRRPPTSKSIGSLAGCALVAGSYLGIRAALHIPSASLLARGSALEHVKSYATCVVVYGRAALVPGELSIFHVYRPVTLEIAALVWACLLGVSAGLFWAARSSLGGALRTTLFGWLGALFALLLPGLTAPVHFQIGDRYAYFPLALLLLALAAASDFVIARRPVLAAPVALALSSLCVVGSFPLERRLAEWRTARGLFEVELSRDERRYWARQMLAEMDAQQGRYAEAERELLRARRDAPETKYRIDVALCYVYLNEDRLDDAITACERALAENPADPRAWVNLADARLLARRYDDALAAADSAAALKPRYAEAAYARAAALHGLGRDDDARGAVAAALEYDPNHARARELANQLFQRPH